MQQSRVRIASAIGVVGLASLAALTPGCADSFDTTRTPPPRGTVGEEMFGVICDRVGAQALREDMTGGSYHAICHPDPATGQYAQHVDSSLLPAPEANAVDVDGNPISLAVETANRAHNIARIEALGRDRDAVVTALDAAVPDIQIPAKDLSNADPAHSCDALPNQGTIGLRADLTRTLGNFTDLYDDRTIPLLTEAVAHVLDAVKASPDAQNALSHLDARQGYRPSQIALGVAQPLLAYPRLVDLANSLLSLIATDSDPYAGGLFDPTVGAPAGRVPVPGKASPQFQQILKVLHEELRTQVPDPASASLVTKSDTNDSSRDVLNRPLDDLELLHRIVFPSLAATPAPVDLSSQPLVMRDRRGVALVPLDPTTHQIPAPFVDADGDGLADLDANWDFITKDGSRVPSPFFSIDGVDGPRQNGLAVNGSLPMYAYFDTRATILAKLTSDIVPLLDPTPGKETLVNGIGGALPLLFGAKDTSPATSKTYPPDPLLPQAWALQHPGTPAPANLATSPVVLSYAGYHADSSPLADLVYAVGQVLSDPTTDDTLNLFQQLVSQHPNEVARLMGVGLQIKALADMHSEAHIPAASTLWDELLDVIAQIAAVYDPKTGGILEDLISAFGDDRTLALQAVFASYIDNKDQLTYQNAQHAPASGSPDLNGPAYDLSTGGVTPMSTPVDRTQPDTGANRSALQRFMQLLHDANGLGACTKAGAVAPLHITIPGVGVNLAVNYPTDALAKTACAIAGGGNIPPDPMPECGILRIKNVDQLLLDVALGRAQFEIPDPCLNALLSNNLVTGLIDGGADGFLQQQSGINGFDLHPTVAGISRLVYYDTAHDSDPGDTSFPLTKAFLEGVIDPVPSMACDPAPYTDPKTGEVIPTRKCSSFDLTLRGRDLGSLFPLEQLNFIQNVQPLAAAFDDHGKPLLFVQLFDALHLHWGSAAQTKAECDPTLPRTDARWCSQDGAVTYEPLLSAALKTDLFAALHDFIPLLKATKVAHCNRLAPVDPANPTLRQCASDAGATTTYDGVHVLSEAVRALVDPARAAKLGVVTRTGSAQVARNDGTMNPQVTPIYLLIDALKGIDSAFANYQAANGGDTSKHQGWRAARSQLVDTFLSVNGTGTSSTWANPVIPRLLPLLLQTLRAQVGANCPTARIDGSCSWGRSDLTRKISTTIDGPLFAGVVDLVDAIRSDAAARGELEQLAQYLLGPTTPAAQQATVTAIHDVLQVFEDETNLTPLVNALAEAAGGSLVNDGGQVVRRSAVDALVEVLARVLAKAHDAQGREVCADEIDPNRGFASVLQHVVLPLAATQPTAIEVLLDAIADVNREHPEVDFSTQLEPTDYGSIAAEISDFCENGQSGLEQVYEVIREATSGG